MRTVDRTLNIGLLGTGYIAHWHAEALRSVRNTRLAAICDLDAERVHAFGARYGVTRVYTSLSAMLSDGQLDVIHILLPPELHAHAAEEVIDAGLHVLMEKPMALSTEACMGLLERARSRGIRIGVSHNFLFTPIYECLKNDMRSGKLGQPDEVTITWNKGLDQLQGGPFDVWMLRAPENIMLEVGPHSVAHMLDLVGLPEIVSVRPMNPVDLPGGARFFRRWRVEAGRSSTGVTLNFSFVPGFAEHSIHVRGSLASATADFERNTYVLHRHTKFGLDYDRYRRTVQEAKELGRQARSTFAKIVLSKLKPCGGNPYGQSIARGLQSFYAHLADFTDLRLSPELGRDIVNICIEIGRRASVETASLPSTSTNATPSMSGSASPRSTAHREILVLGATGFIGRELARQLVAAGHPIRVLVRNPSRLPPDLRGGDVEVVVGSLSKSIGLDPALEGIRCVYHLARPLVKTWDEYTKHEVEVTRRLANACLTAKVERLIYTGTIDCYYAGAKARTITEDTPLDLHIGWRNYYAQSKALSEQILMSLYHQNGLPVVIFRPGIVIGRGGSPLHWGIGMWSWNSVCQIWGKGDNPLPFVLVEDVVQALVTALGVQGIEGESFNLVSDSRLSALGYLKALEECTGVEFQKIPTPPWKFYLVDLAKWVIKRTIRHPDRRKVSYRDWETRTQRAHYDCTKARKLLNWKPTSEQIEIINRGIRLPASKLLA
jgi:nucleoside-diphosphate-sugar epimerase/predicted dehydrogenase